MSYDVPSGIDDEKMKLMILRKDQFSGERALLDWIRLLIRTDKRVAEMLYVKKSYIRSFNELKEIVSLAKPF